MHGMRLRNEAPPFLTEDINLSLIPSDSSYWPYHDYHVFEEAITDLIVVGVPPVETGLSNSLQQLGKTSRNVNFPENVKIESKVNYLYTGNTKNAVDMNIKLDAKTRERTNKRHGCSKQCKNEDERNAPKSNPLTTKHGIRKGSSSGGRIAIKKSSNIIKAKHGGKVTTGTFKANNTHCKKNIRGSIKFHEKLIQVETRLKNSKPRGKMAKYQKEGKRLETFTSNEVKKSRKVCCRNIRPISLRDRILVQRRFLDWFIIPNR